MNPQDVADHRRPARAAVLLVNLGTPDAPTPSAIRRYLRQFLSDRRVLELARPLWQLILNLFILPFRPRGLAHAYGSVWSEEGSPLLAISRRQAGALQTRLARRFGDRVDVALAMTYGEPSFERTLAELHNRRVERLVVLPLYPQYSATTTAAAFDALWRVLMTQRRVPALRTVDSYHDDPAYIAALATQIRTHWQHNGRGDHLLMSFHAIPQEYLERGDPYFCLCHKSARLLAQALDLDATQWSVSFQSRLGNRPWLKPYTDRVVPQLAAAGAKTLDVICPGFSADCLETLEEVAQRYRDDFLAAGGRAFRYIPALNDSSEHLDMLELFCARELDGWLPAATPPVDAERLAATARALASDTRLESGA